VTGKEEETLADGDRVSKTRLCELRRWRADKSTEGGKGAHQNRTGRLRPGVGIKSNTSVEEEEGKMGNLAEGEGDERAETLL